MYGLNGEVHDLVARRCDEIDVKAACPVQTDRLGIGPDGPHARYVEEGARLPGYRTVLTPQPVPGEVAVTPRRLMSACPQGHPLPMQPTRWFDGIAWRDGREACRHCYEANSAMDQTTAAAS
jgi:hypothetical protein